MNDTKKVIVDFVKDSEKVRTKDIVDKFKNFSERTVKRNLSQLVRSKILAKQSVGKTTVYSIKA